MLKCGTPTVYCISIASPLRSRSCVCDYAPGTSLCNGQIVHLQGMTRQHMRRQYRRAHMIRPPTLRHTSSLQLMATSSTAAQHTTTRMAATWPLGFFSRSITITMCKPLALLMCCSSTKRLSSMSMAKALMQPWGTPSKQLSDLTKGPCL